MDEAVQRLLAELDEGAKRELMTYPQEELEMRTHFGLGLWIRNEFGLADGSNSALFNDCARRKHHSEDSAWTLHEDDASSVIVEALWRRLSVQGE